MQPLGGGTYMDSFTVGFFEMVEMLGVTEIKNPMRRVVALDLQKKNYTSAKAKSLYTCSCLIVIQAKWSTNSAI